jgi:MFS family permease
VETLGRKLSLFISAMGMGTLFYIVGAIWKTHPIPVLAAGQVPPAPPPASQAMAAMLYIYVCFYSMGWGEHMSFLSQTATKLRDPVGPLPWVYVSDIFPTRTRHYGLAFASASQWLWST